MILVVDNYDSFAYNLVQYVGEALDASNPTVNRGLDAAEDARGDRGTGEPDLVVRRNDAITIPEIRELDPDGIVVSPGPGTPREAGISTAIFEEDYPALGVCLGHQALCAVHGAPVVHADAVVHGKASAIRHDGAGIFDGLPDPFEAGRYHSLGVRREDLPEELVETAWMPEEDAIVMGVRHRTKPHVGVQFHPESILTRASDGAESDGRSLEIGKRLVANFCREVA